MKVLIICSGNANKENEQEIKQPFIKDQVHFLKESGIEIDVFLVFGKGVSGYLRNLRALLKRIKEGNHDLIHAHYGLSGMLASFQKKRPLLITFHGSDINLRFNRIISNIAFLRSSAGIFVSERLYKRLIIKNNRKRHIIPCGVDLSYFKPIDKTLARKKLGLSLSQYTLLFSSGFDNKVKNYLLAKSAVSLTPEVVLVELKNRSRSEVNLLLNACDGLLMTSLTEGSPQIIKEALACNCPIISNDVGDVKSLLHGIDGCFITADDPIEINKRILQVLKNPVKVEGRRKIDENRLDVRQINDRIIQLYGSLIREHENIY
jgi:teichuronic acid biosynthesis glycosyltransferase TuaC